MYWFPALYIKNKKKSMKFIVQNFFYSVFPRSKVCKQCYLHILKGVNSAVNSAPKRSREIILAGRFFSWKNFRNGKTRMLEVTFIKKANLREVIFSGNNFLKKTFFQDRSFPGIILREGFFPGILKKTSKITDLFYPINRILYIPPAPLCYYPLCYQTSFILSLFGI